MIRPLSIGILAILTASGAASAAHIFHGVNAAGTSSTLHGGDRELNTMSFTGSGTVFNGGNFLNFANGSLTNNISTYGWNDAIPRDMDGGSTVSGNPDRDDSATVFTGEGAATGTLAEVFGPFSFGYKNMNYIIDGEDDGNWHVDLLFAAGYTISGDGDDSTVELAVLERGINSDFQIYGIRADNTLTGPIFVNASNVTATGWQMDTLEINEMQDVGGIGISLDASWTDIKGFRIESLSNFGGPDIVAVGTATPVPTPGALALLSLAGLTAIRRNRK